MVSPLSPAACVVDAPRVRRQPEPALERINSQKRVAEHAVQLRSANRLRMSVILGGGGVLLLVAALVLLGYDLATGAWEPRVLAVPMCGLAALAWVFALLPSDHRAIALLCVLCALGRTPWRYPTAAGDGPGSWPAQPAPPRHLRVHRDSQAAPL